MRTRFYVATYWTDGKVTESVWLTQATAERLAAKLRQTGGVKAVEVRRTTPVSVDDIFNNPKGWLR